MRSLLVESVTDEMEVYPIGRTIPDRAPDVTLTASPEIGAVVGFAAQFQLNTIEVVEITRRIRMTQHVAVVIQETWRVWV